MKPLLLLTAAALAAQTSLDLSQLKSTTATEFRVLVVSPDGRVRPIRLPSSVQITEAADGTIYMVLATAAPEVKAYRLTRSTDGTYALPATGLVHRNGLLMEEGEDYAISGGVLTPKQPWDAADKVTLRVISATAPIIGRKP